MYAFDYHRPKTLAEAGQLLTGEAKALSGGQTLIPTLKQRLARPSALVDLTHIPEMKGIQVGGGWVSIGAATTHVAVQDSPEVQKAIPALAELASHIGDRQVRYMGTIGGSVANNDPAADYPSAVLGLGATIHTTKRKIAADDFFKGLFETALEEGELITRIDFPVPERAGRQKFPNPASRYAIVGAFVAKTKAGARVAITGAGPCVFRWKEAEAALSTNWSADAVANLKHPADGLNSDIHASAEYRAHLITVMTKRAVAAS